ncbi:hypothetical protein [Actinoplanes flavus]|uniref:Uncharacterized protein n=1 Tax=Actinoplanes flavus TaxID=2820290 RepID=A0ABS3V0K0_9ACTN|nr:hypothetical protein [Actinoplanes flavus]MBO3744339.1 hypothetical protein [Actinoplanes flavus]
MRDGAGAATAAPGSTPGGRELGGDGAEHASNCSPTATASGWSKIVRTGVATHGWFMWPL